MPGQSVCAVIVSYNPPVEILENIAALRPQVNSIVVVDNGSSEPNLEMLRRERSKYDFEVGSLPVRTMEIPCPESGATIRRCSCCSAYLLSQVANEEMNWVAHTCCLEYMPCGNVGDPFLNALRRE
jgi:hypothetical protein